MPAGGLPVTSLFSPDQLEDFNEYLATFCGQCGLPPLTLRNHLPSSRAALAVTEFARAQGQLTAFREAVMEDFWLHDLDLEDPPQLGRLAQKLGLDFDAAVAAVDDPLYTARVDALRQEASEQGVHAIPSFFFGELPPVVGCQPLSSLADLARRAGAQRR